MATQDALREDVLWLLSGGRAHVEFQRAVADLPEAVRGRKPRGAPYTPWQQVDHIGNGRHPRVHPQPQARVPRVA